jgi:ESCRT-II complex subunit VPS36
LCLDVANDRDAVLEVLQKALHRQAWLLQSKLEEKKQQQQQQHTYKTRKVGVDAVLAKSKQRHREAAKLTDSAFATDVDTLLSEASELVAIIHRYTAALNQQQSHHSSTESDDSNSNNDAVELSNMLEDMGMASALSRDQFGKGSRRKKSSNNDYYDQTIARQLSDFLRYKNRLTDAGGLMTLTDVYCLFNRARGTNMISPNDLLRAVAWMDQPEFAHLRMHQRTFPSGVVVLQDADFDEEGTSQKLQELATSAHPESGGDGGVTALHVSKALKISAMLANEQLLSAERLGYLCRDVTLEGIRFFPNRFNTYIT